MRRSVLALAAALTLAGCSAEDPTSAAPVPSQQTSTAPTPTGTATGSATAAAATDPACSTAGLDTFLDGMAEHSGRAGLDDDAPTLDWQTALWEADDNASGTVKALLEETSTILDDYLNEASGTAESRRYVRALAVSAQKLAAACGLDVDITVPAKASPKPTRRPKKTQAPARPSADRRYDSCAEANRAGHGPYHRGSVEYGWYQDRDGDGTVCEPS